MRLTETRGKDKNKQKTPGTSYLFYFILLLWYWESKHAQGINFIACNYANQLNECPCVRGNSSPFWKHLHILYIYISDISPHPERLTFSSRFIRLSKWGLSDRSVDLGFDPTTFWSVVNALTTKLPQHTYKTTFIAELRSFVLEYENSPIQFLSDQKYWNTWLSFPGLSD